MTLICICLSKRNFYDLLRKTRFNLVKMWFIMIDNWYIPSKMVYNLINHVVLKPENDNISDFNGHKIIMILIQIYYKFMAPYVKNDYFKLRYVKMTLFCNMSSWWDYAYLYSQSFKGSKIIQRQGSFPRWKRMQGMDASYA